MSDILVRSLARAQAPLRLAELNGEIQTRQDERQMILGEFPDLIPRPVRPMKARPAKARPKRRRALASIDPELAVLASPRPKRTMSTAQRKAVSIRMTKYWAARRRAKR